MIYQKICYYLEEVERIVRGEMQYPISVEIDPSNRCQNDCSFCMYRKYRNENNVDLRLDIYAKLLGSLSDVGVKSITFTGGGEPTMHPEFESMVYQALARGFEVGLVTNGIKLSSFPDLLGAFKFVRISVDAATRETYAKIKRADQFHLVADEIRNFKTRKDRSRTTFGISFVVCEENKNEISIFKNKFRDHVDYIQIKPDVFYMQMPDGVEDGKTAVTSRYLPLDTLPCDIAGLVGIVGADGNIYFCCQTRGKEEYCIGSLYEEDFRMIWFRRKLIKPDISSCPPCRYMNYAEDYERYKGSKYSYLRHRNFL